MKQKFALLTIAGALLALAVPASSSASIYPAGAKFELGSGEAAPRVATSLGYCTLKFTGQVPAAPANEAAGGSFAIPTPTVPFCIAGMSTTVSGSWKLTVGGGYYPYFTSASSEAIVMRSTSLPKCKLTGPAALGGIWSNGTTTPSLLKSGYHAHKDLTWTWANDGGTCAVAGATEPVKWESGNSSYPVNNLTTPTVPIIIGN